jgi:hypothetical protein
LTSIFEPQNAPRACGNTSNPMPAVLITLKIETRLTCS